MWLNYYNYNFINYNFINYNNYLIKFKIDSYVSLMSLFGHAGFIQNDICSLSNLIPRYLRLLYVDYFPGYVFRNYLANVWVSEFLYSYKYVAPSLFYNQLKKNIFFKNKDIFLSSWVSHSHFGYFSQSVRNRVTTGYNTNEFKVLSDFLKEVVEKKLIYEEKKENFSLLLENIEASSSKRMDIFLKNYFYLNYYKHDKNRFLYSQLFYLLLEDVVDDVFFQH